MTDLDTIEAALNALHSIAPLAARDEIAALARHRAGLATLQSEWRKSATIAYAHGEELDAAYFEGRGDVYGAAAVDLENLCRRGAP